jgi:hypothetical protein
MSVRRKPDEEATPEENAARVIDNAADQYKERVRLFKITLRSNVAKLSDYKRQQLAAWIKRVDDGLVRAVDEDADLPGLGLSDYPDMD